MLLSLLSKRSLYDDSRDAYGFTVRPQHIHRYREYASIYRVEEEERLEKWESFLEQQAESTVAQHCNEINIKPVVSEVTEQSSDPAEIERGERDDSTVEQVSGEGHNLRENRSESGSEGTISTKEVPTSQQAKSREVKTWAEISPSLNRIEHMMSERVKKRKNMKSENINIDLPSNGEAQSMGGETEGDNERLDSANTSSASDKISEETNFSWMEELESLVQGGVPKDLRGEVWQAFVGVRTRRIESYYRDLLATECDTSDGKEQDQVKKDEMAEKWKKQIEKDLPRTFPGHPALNENGRNSLRRVLLAYSRHNPSVGYCQAMNFFAGLLLLMMPEENAFWTLVGIIDDYFEGYFSQEMIESQVDQLVFEDLVRERFPKLVNHLDLLGVEVAWISGPWFLSIFINTLPWESVLRVWDVILFEGNRVMLFRTGLALMDLYGPALVTTKDAGDAITSLQTLTGCTFDSSQLVLTACMGFLTVTEDRLQELRQKHRPTIVAAVEERAKGGRVSKAPKRLATKLYSFKHDRGSTVKEKKTEGGLDDKSSAGEKLKTDSGKLDETLEGIDSEVDSLPDLQEQVVWLKVELCRLLEEKKAAVLRAEELEAALMEMATEDNRRELSARVEELEAEVAELRQILADKKAGEDAILQVLLKVEQEQRVTEDARLFAEQQAAVQKQAVHVIQEKYDQAIASLAEMEKRAVMAESMLEATLQYESGQNKALSSPKPGKLDSPGDMPIKKTSLLPFTLGWRDRSKGKPSNDAENPDADTNGHREESKG